jgi:NitT/TauT family transport system substrate-binding protein
MAHNYDALRAGQIDVMQAFEPFAAFATTDRAGDILYTASARGPTAYTAFIATRDAVARHRDDFAAMARATAQMLQWLYTHPAEQLAAAVASFFPDVPAEILASSLRRYRDAGLWSREPLISRQGFTRLAQSLHSGGFIARMPSYDECVEPGLNVICS